MTGRADGPSTSEAVTRARDLLAAIPQLCWDDLETVHASAAPVLKALAADRGALRAMVERIPDDPTLMAMCERHFLLDYFVLHDAPERRFRLRLHMHTDNAKERPHNHRFPFTTYVLLGSYLHLIHTVRGELGDHSTIEDLSLAYRTTEKAGSCYTIAPATVHTTYARPDTVSIVIRGPAIADRSIIMDRETGRVTWRHGRQAESAARRATVAMSPADFHRLAAKLKQLEII